MKTIIVKQPDGTVTLERNERPLICPFMTGTPMIDPNSLQGQRIHMAFNPCSSNCVHFNTHKVNDSYKVELTCGGKENIIIGEEKKEPKPSILRS